MSDTGRVDSVTTYGHKTAIAGIYVCPCRWVQLSEEILSDLF